MSIDKADVASEERVLLPWPWLSAAFGLAAASMGAVTAALDVTIPNMGVIVALLFLFWQMEMIPITVAANAEASAIRRRGWSILRWAVLVPVGFGLSVVLTRWLLDQARIWSSQ